MMENYAPNAESRIAGLLISDGLRKIDGKWRIAQEHVSRSIGSAAADRANAQTAANEAAAVASLRTLNTALVTYVSMFGRGYPATLRDLAAADGGRPTSAGLIDAALASGVKNGYTFAYSPAASNGGVIVSYTIQASPSDGWGHRFVFH